ncbi:MAG: hypothetical protein AAF351_09350 [Pseudomonadota bacterium]
MSVSFALAACGGGGGGSANRPAQPGPNPPTATCDNTVEFCGVIPGSADPCTEPQYWPLNESSTVRPLTVHFPRSGNQAKALEMLSLLEDNWDFQVDTLGFAAPLDDQGQCGDDGNYDIFIWPGIDGAFVAGVATNPATPYRDWTTYMAIDISGSTGGEFLDTFMAHEFNHAVQASDDWTEEGQHYEAGATFAEALVYPDETDWYFEMEDFQSRPEWSLFFDDMGATWYTYAAAMYLHYLYERHYPGDPAFYARIWRGTRNATGQPRPDYIDALRQVLQSERGVTLDETVVEFMQWRWFVDQFDDGAHFAKGAEWPYTVEVTDLEIGTAPVAIALNAQIYGGNYFRFTNTSGAPTSWTATIDHTDPDVTWRLVDVASGEIVAPIAVASGESRVVFAIPLPVTDVWTDTLSFDDRAATLNLQ